MLVQDPRLSGGSVNPFFPGTEMHPLAKMSKDKCIKYINQHTASVFSKATKDPPAQFVWLSLDLARSPRELLDLHSIPKRTSHLPSVT